MAGPPTTARARRLRARYVIPCDHPAPARLRARLDDVAMRALPEALGAALDGIGGAADASVWRIRQLEVQLALDAAWDPERIGRAWARRIAGAVRAVMAREPDGDLVVRFDDRAAYVGGFVSEVAQGTAWARWYFDAFEGLRPLAPSAAIRTALIAERDDGIRGLLAMGNRELALVVETLSARDAWRVAQAVTATAAAPGDAVAFGGARRAFRTLADAGITASGEERLVLRICLEAARVEGDACCAALFVGARAIARLASLVSRGSIERRRAIADALARDAVASLLEWMPIRDAEVVAPLARAERAWIEGLVEELAAAPTMDLASSPPAARDGEVIPRVTLFGGLFLLLRELVELPVAQATDGWPDCGAASAATVVRFLLALGGGGAGAARRNWYDAVTRDVMGAPPDLAASHVAEWARRISRQRWARFAAVVGSGAGPLPQGDLEWVTLPPELVSGRAASRALATGAAGLLRRFAARLPGFAQSSLPYLFTNFLDVRASIEDESSRRVVRLGRPPLELVLRMGGMGRGTVAVPWLDARPFVLFPGDAT